MFIIGRKCFTKHEYLKSSFSKSTDNDIGIILFLLKIIVCNPDSLIVDVFSQIFEN